MIVVAHYTGMTVAQMTEFRKRMKEAGGAVKVAKNKLAKLALKDTDAQGIADLLKGQTCVAYSEDPISAARVSVKYAKENDKLVILGGAMGKTVLDASAVKALADLPSLDELRAKLIGLVQAPATKIARVAQGAGRQAGAGARRRKEPRAPERRKRDRNGPAGDCRAICKPNIRTRKEVSSHG